MAISAEIYNKLDTLEDEIIKIKQMVFQKIGPGTKKPLKLKGVLKGISVDETYSNLGIGGKLINYLIDKAGDLNLKEVFVLTTQAEDWFESMGFIKGDISRLPKERQYNYDYDRKSIPLFYKLNK